MDFRHAASRTMSRLGARSMMFSVAGPSVELAESEMVIRKSLGQAANLRWLDDGPASTFAV